MAIFTWPLWVFSARTLDRLGKGIRTGARDALLSDEATSQTKGTVFGFHRAMDTLGAATGPLLALLFLYFFPESYRTLFFLAFIPGLLSVFATFLLSEQKRNMVRKEKVSFLSFLGYLPRSTSEYKKLLVGLLAFALFNSSDVFLLLMLKYNGLSDSEMIITYIFYNLVYALFAYPAGILADKMGLKKMLMVGMIIFSSTYFGMGLMRGNAMMYLIFFFYGTYAACTEGISKAWISNVCDKNDTATAIGAYEGLRSIATILASSIAGLIWFYVSPAATFLVTAIAVLFIIIYMGVFVPYSK